VRISILMEALTGKFTTDTDRASKQFQRDMRRMERDAAQMGRRIAAAVTVAAAALTAMVRQQIKVADEMGKTAQRIGVSTEALSQLQHVANLSGTSLEGLQTGLLRLSRTASDAQNGLATAARAFDQIGVSAEKADGTLKDTDQLLLEIADRFSKMEDGAKKAALAQELFGRSGAQLIPMLNQGREGIEALRLEADRLGLTISGETSRAAQAFNDNLTRLQGAATGFARQLTAEMLPALELVSERLSAAAVESGGFRDAAEAGADRIVRSLAFVVDAAEGARRTFQVWGRSLAVTFAAVELGVWQLADSLINGPGRALDWLIEKAAGLTGIDFQFRFGLAVPQFEALMNRAAGIVREGVGDIQDILMAPLPGRSFLEDLAERTARELPPALRAAAEEVRGLADAMAPVNDAAAKMIAALEDQVATLGMSERALQLYRLGLETTNPELIRYADSLLATIEGHQRLTDLQREADAVVQANKTAVELYVDELGRLREMVLANVLSLEEYEKAVARMNEAFAPAVAAAEDAFLQMDEFAKQAARNIQDTLAQFIYDPFRDGVEGMVIDFANAMRRMIAEAAAAAILKQLFGGLAASSNPFLSALGTQFGGSRDSGGRGYPGQAYYIGTGAQPEMFIPDTAGTFVPASQQGGNNITYQTIVQAPEGRITRESEGRLRARDQQHGALMAGRNG
jgi:hypothetical protein